MSKDDAIFGTKGWLNMAARKNIALAVAVAAVAFFVGREYGSRHVPETAIAKPARTEASEPAAVMQPGRSDSNPRPATQRQQVSATLRAQLFEEYRCPQPSCGLNPFIAENENEAVWLRYRGYPSPQQREEAERLPTSELKDRANKGDLVFATLYGERLMEEGNWKDSYPVLLKAVDQGSLYALYALSYQSEHHPEFKDPIGSRAYLRLAYLSGDYKAQFQLIKTFPEFNGTSDDLLTDSLAAHKFRNLMRYRMYPRPPTKE